MPRDAAPAPINDSISVVVNVNKLGRRLPSHDDQASGSLLLLPASICRSFQWLERLPQTARLDGLDSQSRGCDASPCGHGGLLDARFHRVPAEIDDGEHQSAASHLAYYHVSCYSGADGARQVCRDAWRAAARWGVCSKKPDPVLYTY